MRTVLGLGALVIALAASGSALSQAAGSACRAALGAVDGSTFCAPGGEIVALWDKVSDFEQSARPDAQFVGAARRCLRYAEPEAARCLRDRLWSRLHAVAEARQPGALTGRWVRSGRDGAGAVFGVAEIVEPPEGPIRVSLFTQSGRFAHTCRIVRDDLWRSGAELAWTGEIVKGQPSSTCDLSLRRVGQTLVVDGLARCDWACGAQGDYRWTYRLAK